MSCLHRHARTYFTGDCYFKFGEYWDDICEHVVCIECGEHVDCDSICDQMKRPSDA